MKYQLQPLPYPCEALAPYLSAELVRVHHDKHHQAYVDGLNAAEERLARAREAGDLSSIGAICEARAFDYSGHVLHDLYWASMSPAGGGEPQGALAEQLARDFGGTREFETEFLAAADAVQGSGWAVLAWQPVGEELVILQAGNDQNLAAWGAAPILVLDVWEHAYYLQYAHRRQDYTAGFLSVVDWEGASHRFEGA
jgi:Fe-Mn family superoxide dismutase